MDKYTTTEQQGEHALIKNNRTLICPFIPPYPVQGAMGNVAMQITNCNTTCPHATFKDNVYSITCGCEKIDFKIEKEENKLKLV